jgi:UDP-N-acetylmuramoyl-L-alanyl-D-glutamate--2,6-diaminopimelate ligase
MFVRQVNQIVENLIGVKTDGPIYWRDIKDDSRQVVPGDVFIALPSYSGKDGDYYIDQAVRQGANFIIRQSDVNYSYLKSIKIDDKEVACLNIADLKDIHGSLISHFYGLPSAQMTMIGVTGTNGKTSVVNLIAASLEGLNIKCGVIGTLGHGLSHKLLEKQNQTTPCALQLQKILANIAKEDAQVCAMEVSSHGIDQMRVGGICFDIAILTNISHDHLDYHGTMEAYMDCKERLFYDFNPVHIIVNLDDPLGERIFLRGGQGSNLMAYTFKAQGKRNDVAYCRVLEKSLLGQTVEVKYQGKVLQINSRLTGSYNAQNIMSAFLALCMMGYEPFKAIEALQQVTHIPGRFEVIASEIGPTVIVDYAHTPDALKNVLMTLQEVTSSKIWCVFGCGGDRDKEKRPKMGMIAEKYADYVVLTSDNPRSESPRQIIQDIKSQMIANWAIHEKIDRVEAIRYAIKQASRNDVVLIAGKGHETIQIFASNQVAHRDSEVARRVLDGLILEMGY